VALPPFGTAALRIASALVVILACVLIGGWLGLGLGARPGETPSERLRLTRSNLKRNRRERRRLLTRGERIFAFGYLLLSALLTPLAIGLLVLGGGSTVRGIGIGLLLVTLVLYATPLSPILRAKVGKRERRSGKDV
jgi:hypothetical protein